MPKVQMPQLGESVAEGTIGKWLKQPGDHVDKYEPIVEVITDKVNAEVPSPFEGTLTEILVQEGETVPNNTEIAVIEAVGEGAAATGEAPATGGAAAADAPSAMATAEALVDETAPQAAEPAGPYGTGSGPGGSDESPQRTFEQPTAQPAVASAPASVSATTAVAAPTMPGTNGNGNGNGAGAYTGPTTPAVRRLAREHGIDLSMIAGSGHSGRVTREDVLKFVESGGAQAGQTAQPQAPAEQTPMPMTSAPQAGSGQAAQSAASTAAPSPVAQGDSLKSASPMRKAIAAQMTKALQVPVAYTVIEVDMSGVVALRDRNKGQYQ